MKTISRVPARGKDSESGPPAAEARHKPELDGVRGIALLAVMLCHIGPMIRLDSVPSKIIAYSIVPGWSGVELFFVLSGFLITGILLRTKRATNYFSAFYMRRFLRIFPIYYGVLILALVVAHHDSWWSSLLPPNKTRVAYFFYMQNIPAFWPGHVFQKVNAFGHFWSLAVEEQFYLIWPVAIWAFSENVLLWACSVALILAIPLRIFMVNLYSGGFTAFALTTSRMDGLLIGAIVAILVAKGRVRLKWIMAAMAAGLMILGYIAIFHRHELIATYFYMPVFGVTGFSLFWGGLVALSQYPMKRLNRALSAAWLRSVGKYSYGMYVYHIPLYVICERILFTELGIEFPVSLHSAILLGIVLIGITYLIAKLSYDYFESPILGLKRHFKPEYDSTRLEPAPAVQVMQ